MTFKDLNITKPLLNALSDMGFNTPTPIQEKSFPIIMSGRDVVGIAQTGTGKTLAYLLPVLRQMAYAEVMHPRVIIMVPTRELVTQVLEEVKKITAYMSIRSVGVYGDSNINTQKKQIAEGVDLVVGTPGRLIDLVATGVLRTKLVQKLIIDEVDQMLALGFRPQVMNFLDSIPDNRQTLLFSATLNDDVETIIDTFFKNPIWVEADRLGSSSKNVTQQAYMVPNFYTKRNLLVHLLDQPEFKKVLVFISTKNLVEKLAKELNRYFENEVNILHADKMQTQRLAALKDFEEGHSRILISNDLAARGIDIEDISHVINFDLPENTDNYIHRIGRTGRADKTGVAISFVKPDQKTLFKEIETVIKLKIPVLPFPEEVDATEDLIKEEMTVVKEILKVKKYKADPEKGAAFHEKKAKNQKVNLGGARAQESRRRAKLSRLKKRGK